MFPKYTPLFNFEVNTGNIPFSLLIDTLSRTVYKKYIFKKITAVLIKNKRTRKYLLDKKAKLG